MISNAFPIAEKPYWDHESDRGVNDIVKRIEYLMETVKKEALQDPESYEDYTQYHHERYTFECIVGECNSTLTHKDAEKIINSNCVQMLYHWIFNRKWYHVMLKVRNLHKATVEMFPSSFLFEKCSLDDFDVDLVKRVHSGVGKDIIKNAGVFRTNGAAPAGEYTVEYMKPDLIEENLERLLGECRSIFCRTDLKLTDVVKYGACFLERFLYIHPFSNGNGRTARLLLSRLLQSYTIVPLSLLTSGKRKAIYLNCLREARYEGNNQSLLARFTLEAMEREFGLHCYLTDADVI